MGACTVPVPSDEDRHDDAAVAQDGEQDDDGEVDDAALLALLHPGRRPAPLSVREREVQGEGNYRGQRVQCDAAQAVIWLFRIGSP